jgi:dTMP kinase
VSAAAGEEGASGLEPAVGEARPRGRFLVLEGIDGCGKTTQLQALAAWLPASGLLPPGAELICTREPGGTALGVALRQLLLHPEAQQAPCVRAELLLYAADRAQHVERVIRPALRQGHWVLSDRFSGSTAAYQGHGRGLDLELIDQLEAIACGGLRPDLTLWLDLPLALSLERRQRRDADRIEAAGEAFLERVRAGFAALAAQRGWRCIDAAAAAESVGEACRAAVRAMAMAAAGQAGQPDHSRVGRVEGGCAAAACPAGSPAAAPPAMPPPQLELTMGPTGGMAAGSAGSGGLPIGVPGLSAPVGPGIAPAAADGVP